MLAWPGRWREEREEPCTEARRPGDSGTAVQPGVSWRRARATQAVEPMPHKGWDKPGVSSSPDHIARGLKCDILRFCHVPCDT